MSDIRWSVPRWAFVPALWRSLQQSIFNSGSLLRIVVGSVVACGAIVLALKLAIPGFVVPNLWRVALSLLAFLLLFLIQFGLLSVIPPQVRLKPKFLQRSHGQTGLRIYWEDLVATQIIVHREDRVRLKLIYQRRGRKRTLTLGVAPSVELNRLVDALPIEPVVRDARSRSIGIL